MSRKMIERLSSGGVILMDGAMGTRLQELGLAPGEAPESWNLSRSADLASIAEFYSTAGADIVQTNSFGGSPLKLAAHGLADRTVEINRAAATAARAGATAGIHCKAVKKSHCCDGACVPSILAVFDAVHFSTVYPERLPLEA